MHSLSGVPYGYLYVQIPGLSLFIWVYFLLFSLLHLCSGPSSPFPRLIVNSLVGEHTWPHFLSSDPDTHWPIIHEFLPTRLLISPTPTPMSHTWFCSSEDRGVSPASCTWPLCDWGSSLSFVSLIFLTRKRVSLHHRKESLLSLPYVITEDAKSCGLYKG